MVERTFIGKSINELQDAIKNSEMNSGLISKILEHLSMWELPDA